MQCNAEVCRGPETLRLETFDHALFREIVLCGVLSQGECESAAIPTLVFQDAVCTCNAA